MPKRLKFYCYRLQLRKFLSNVNGSKELFYFHHVRLQLFGESAPLSAPIVQRFNTLFAVLRWTRYFKFPSPVNLYLVVVNFRMRKNLCSFVTISIILLRLRFTVFNVIQRCHWTSHAIIRIRSCTTPDNDVLLFSALIVCRYFNS